MNEILQRSGSLVFAENQRFAKDFEAQKGTVSQQATGHVIFYGPDHERILLADPDGNPLHECLWTKDAQGRIQLSAARMYLDWGRWVGMKPGGLENITTMDLSKRPGWERITRQDLRGMAAQSMGVPLSEVEFFYKDDDVVIRENGQATIRQRKDAFYVLDDGTFGNARFMSCFSAMNWESIDYLPVVELFLSLLPGTGSAAFELIRGLYDDQNRQAPRPLQYRGIPTYPSPAAFSLFGAFFTPSTRGQEDPFAVFMDQTRSHEVSWYPTPCPLQRYVNAESQLCVTMADTTIQKVTRQSDTAGLSYQKADRKGFTPHGRTLFVKDNTLTFVEFQHKQTVTLPKSLQGLKEISARPTPPAQSDWRNMFPQGPPVVTSDEAFAAVLMYPDDETMIGEVESQPFVTDYLDDLVEEVPEFSRILQESMNIVVENFDAAIVTCLNLTHRCDHMIVYSKADLVQKQVQNLWNKLARANHLDWLGNFQFQPIEENQNNPDGPSADLVYSWIPFATYGQQETLNQQLVRIKKSLRKGGMACIAGPMSLGPLLQPNSLEVMECQPVSELPTFHMHRAILPKAHIHPDLTVWILKKSIS
jgi:hypothetical protein